MLYRLISLSLVGTLLVGCNPAKSARMTPAISDAETQLLNTATSVEKSLREIAAAQDKPTKRAINTSALTTAKGGLGHKVGLDWSGPVDALLKRLAEFTQYEVKIVGNTPAIPVIVSVTYDAVTVADVLKDVGLQMGSRGDVVVFPSTRVIELRYTPT